MSLRAAHTAHAAARRPHSARAAGWSGGRRRRARLHNARRARRHTRLFARFRTCCTGGFTRSCTGCWNGCCTGLQLNGLQLHWLLHWLPHLHLHWRSPSWLEWLVPLKITGVITLDAPFRLHIDFTEKAACRSGAAMSESNNSGAAGCGYAVGLLGPLPVKTAKPAFGNPTAANSPLLPDGCH